MAENEPLTPEKQLLNLIENPRREVLQAESAKRESKKWFSSSALKGRLAFWKSFSLKKWLTFRRSSESQIHLRQINLISKIAILCLTAYLGYSAVMMGLDLKKASNLIFPDQKKLDALPKESSMLKDISFYLERVSARDVFKPVQGAQQEVKEPPAPIPASESKEAQNLSLVGISWSVNPEAMIEDTESKRTFFVRKGQSVGPDGKVIMIFKDRVIINVKGKEIELK